VIIKATGNKQPEWSVNLNALEADLTDLANDSGLTKSVVEFPKFVLG